MHVMFNTSQLFVRINCFETTVICVLRRNVSKHVLDIPIFLFICLESKLKLHGRGKCRSVRIENDTSSVKQLGEANDGTDDVFVGYNA